MSVFLMAKAWQASVKNSARKLVLMKLADNADDDGICWPSYNHLAAQCEMSRRTVIRHVDDLILAGFIKKTTRKGGIHFNKSNMFQLLIDEGDINNLQANKAEAIALKQVKNDSPSDNLSLGDVVTENHPTGDRGSSDLVTETTRPSDTGSPRTIIDPSIEPSLKPLSKKQTKKPDYIRDLFEAYPAHRRGGTDAQLWKVWQQEKLDDQDAVWFLHWVVSAAQNDPAQWGVNSNGQFVLGLTKFVRERHWLTPLPVTQVQPSTSQPANFHSGDVRWAENLGDL
ncbi:helix-turn-helix domain-containing protein [Psychromonas sp. 14N.309.X.WAT.B.A12]|uniref:helix-turn-helix domain-containing protein n=1 Tax=Psychromonas sp. 14N.309.X.WAT.B.A12 TaxID=2998322 RepID=UPI0025B08F3A|nr:helix-turn-helix domain-containing protein [Psychromonas sp. 14N.309.X.WAT.B.A12]MDN2661824.1 helix-turn-helix domain-containing protein [Psychromonas sp. 14N.309.X.WAT.B.A12]